MRPLDRLTSVKAKLSAVIVVAVGISALVSTIGLRVGIPIWIRPPISIVVTLAVVYPFARGITSPLREMVAATRAVAAGRPVGPVRATSRDEVGQLARAFNDMRAQLDEVDRQRRDLVANVSHELRTPISALQATLENLVDGVEAPDPEHLGIMLRQTERLSRMVAQLLDLSRLESGASPLRRRRFALVSVLDQAAAEAGVLWPGAAVDVRCPGDLEVDGDAERVHQVVANLVENAVRHSPPGAPVVVTAARREGSTAGSMAGTVVIEVVDRGPGIPPAEAERVFERFYRADRSRAAEKGGSGLGLAIVRWIVDLHGGRVRVDTARTSGCGVTVELPVAAADTG